MVEGGEDVCAPLVTDGEATESSEPSQGALNHPAVSAQALAALDAAAGDARNNGPPAQRLSAEGEIIAFVGVQLGRAAAWAAGALPDRRYGIDHLLQQLAVVPVGRRNPHGQGDAVGIDEDVALGTRLAAVRRVRPGLLAPLFAGTAVLSTAARSQLIALA